MKCQPKPFDNLILNLRKQRFHCVHICLSIHLPEFVLFLFPFLCVDSFSSPLSLVFPSAHLCLLSTSHLNGVDSFGLSVKGRTTVGKSRYPAVLSNLSPHFYPSPHPSWPTSLWYNKGIKLLKPPQPPTDLSYQGNHKSWYWRIGLWVMENPVCCVRCRISPFFLLILKKRWNGLEWFTLEFFPLFMFDFKAEICKSSFGWTHPVRPTKCNKIFSIYRFILGTQWKPLHFETGHYLILPCQLLKLW